MKRVILLKCININLIIISNGSFLQYGMEK